MWISGERSVDYLILGSINHGGMLGQGKVSTIHSHV